jgi:hypothetical protein
LRVLRTGIRPDSDSGTAGFISINPIHRFSKQTLSSSSPSTLSTVFQNKLRLLSPHHLTHSFVSHIPNFLPRFALQSTKPSFKTFRPPLGYSHDKGILRSLARSLDLLTNEEREAASPAAQQPELELEHQTTNGAT